MIDIHSQSTVLRSFKRNIENFNGLKNFFGTFVTGNLFVPLIQ